MKRAPTCLWPLKAQLGEGPVWWRDGLWFVDILGARLHRFTPASGEQRSWSAPGPIGFALPTADGDLIAGVGTSLHRFSIDAGTFSPMVQVEPPGQGTRLNDAAVDGQGRLWFGSLREDASQASGCLYRLESDGSVRRMDEGYVVANGPAFSPDGATLYHTDSHRQTVFAFDLDDAGQATNKRTFATIEASGVYPDGMTVDAEGCLWIALFGGRGLRRYSPTGEHLSTIDLPCARVTKAAFGGPDLKTLFITTARAGLGWRDRLTQPLAGGLFAVETEVGGLPTGVVGQGVRTA